MYICSTYLAFIASIYGACAARVSKFMNLVRALTTVRTVTCFGALFIIASRCPVVRSVSFAQSLGFSPVKPHLLQT